MGYTHYWDKKGKFNEKQFTVFTDKVKTIIESIAPEGPLGGVWWKCTEDGLEDQISIVGGSGEKNSKPILSKDEVCFNGFGDEAHESFYIQNNDDSLNNFNFCKTARKPYDIAVTASLIAFKYSFPYATTISSDGNINEWADGLELYNKIVKKKETVTPGQLETWLKE